TGAASGIGEAVARRFFAEGACIGLMDRDAERLAVLEQSLGANDERVMSRVLDVGDEAAVAASVDAFAGPHGPLDIAVNCAGILGPSGPLHETDTGEYRALMATNLDGMFHCLKHQLRHMHGRGQGSIVNIASAAGIVGFPGAAAYTAAKHGVAGLTRTCAIDYAEQGIRVNAIAPGGIDTPLIRATTCATPEGKQMIESMHPVKRLGTPDEIANAAAFLASEEASFITGSVLAVDGGWTTW
ncbi:MAG: SDR family NAD(P)-dependent oxidoreductase, partial [Chromatocurvus sp.]